MAGAKHIGASFKGYIIASGVNIIIVTRNPYWLSFSFEWSAP